VTRDDLVARRLKYIQRQIQLDKSAVNVQFVGLAPEGRGPLNRQGLSKLPVGQHEVKNWPVLDLGEVPDIPVRMITPKPYAWKGAKWIGKIEFLAEDRKGFWRVRWYSNSAEPWFNDRYVTE